MSEKMDRILGQNRVTGVQRLASSHGMGTATGRNSLCYEIGLDKINSPVESLLAGERQQSGRGARGTLLQPNSDAHQQGAHADRRKGCLPGLHFHGLQAVPGSGSS